MKSCTKDRGKIYKISLDLENLGMLWSLKCDNCQITNYHDFPFFVVNFDVPIVNLTVGTNGT